MTLGTHLRSAVVSLFVAAVPALAQVACTSPDALCTGDPCVIGSVDVGDPCVLDFGARTVVVAGTLRLPTNGTLSLAGGAIAVSGSLQNRPDARNVGGAGPRIALTADGDIDVTGRIRLNGRVLRSLGDPVPGTLAIDAGGALHLGGSVRTTTVPTAVELGAGGAVAVTGRIAVARGDAAVTISAGDGVGLDGALRGLARIAVDAGGDVALARTLRFSERLAVTAGGVVTVATPIRLPRASLTLAGAAGVDVERRVDVRAIFQTGGSVELTSAAGPIAIAAPLAAEHITVTAAGDVAVSAPVGASPAFAAGGTLAIASLGGNVAVDAELTALPGDGTRPGDGAGGDVEVRAATAVVVHGDIRVNSFLGTEGAPGGTVLLEAATVRVGPDVTLVADGDVPGPEFAGRPPASLRFAATAGDLVLDGIFRARGGPSVIEGTAAADVIASGRFEAQPNGCIALAAGGTLDVAGATFDTPPIADCP